MKCRDCSEYREGLPGRCLRHGMEVWPEETCNEFRRKERCGMDKGGFCAETGSPCDPSCRMRKRP